MQTLHNDLGNIERLKLRTAPWNAMFQCGSTGGCECFEKARRQRKGNIAFVGDKSQHRQVFRREAQTYVFDCGKVARLDGHMIESKVAEVQTKLARGSQVEIVGSAGDAEAHPVVPNGTLDFLSFQEGQWRPLRVDKEDTVEGNPGSDKGDAA